MAVKLFREGTYELKDTKEIVKLHESADGSFWYWKDYNSDNGDDDYLADSHSKHKKS